MFTLLCSFSDYAYTVHNFTIPYYLVCAKSSYKGMRKQRQEENAAVFYNLIKYLYNLRARVNLKDTIES